MSLIKLQSPYCPKIKIEEDTLQDEDAYLNSGLDALSPSQILNPEYPQPVIFSMSTQNLKESSIESEESSAYLDPTLIQNYIKLSGKLKFFLIFNLAAKSSYCSYIIMASPQNNSGSGQRRPSAYNSNKSYLERRVTPLKIE